MTKPITNAEIAEQLALAKTALASVRFQNDESVVPHRQCTYCFHGSDGQRAHDQECPIKVLASVQVALRQLQETRAALRAILDDHDVQSSVMRSSEAQYKLRKARALLGEE